MNNKYIYSFLKDAYLRSLCMLPILGVIFCLVLIRLGKEQELELKDIQEKAAIIAQIPDLQQKLIQVVKGNNDTGLTLNGIIADNTQAMAIINGNLVKFEDTINGKKLVTITARSATLCDLISNKCTTLYLEK